MSVAKWLKGLFEFSASDPLVSVVFLLKEPRPVNETMVTLAAARAWGDEEFVVDWPRVRMGEWVWGFQSGREMFLDDLAGRTGDGQSMKAVRAHRGWISMDVQQGPATDEAYRKMGRLMAALLTANCLAVYYPQREVLFANDEEAAARLVELR